MKRKLKNNPLIIDLPVELIAYILSFLGKDDYYRTRSVCRFFENVSRHDLIKQLEESKIQKIFAKGHHSFFITKKGDVFCCGGIDNCVSPDNLKRPTHIRSLQNITEITGDQDYTIFKENHNILHGYGKSNILRLNSNNELLSSPIKFLTLPSDDPKKPSEVSVVFGKNHVFMFEKDNDRVSGQGSNHKGQLGLGERLSYIAEPILIPISDVSDIITGEDYTFFINKTNRTVWSCGRNYSGQLGLGSLGDDVLYYKIPTQIMGLTNVVKIATTYSHTLFLHENGTVSVCGSDFNGELGLGFEDDVHTCKTPILIPGLEDIVDIAVGKSHSLFLTKGGKVLACGSNRYGQLGLGNIEFCKKPTLIPDLTDVISIAAGSIHSLFLKKDNTVFACGDNEYGALGLGPLDSARTPTPVTSLNYWKKPMESMMKKEANLSSSHENKKIKRI